jgi:hypothetical protein
MTAVPACLQCGTGEPSADGQCPDVPWFQLDHFVGTRHGCRYCGRLKETCALRPCTQALDDVFSPGPAAPG